MKHLFNDTGEAFLKRYRTENEYSSDQTALEQLLIDITFGAAALGLDLDQARKTAAGIFESVTCEQLAQAVNPEV